MLPPPRITFGERLGSALYALYASVMTALEFFFNPLQRLVGAKRMPYVFVLPNLLIFGIFVLFPMLMNFYYAFTGGTALRPEDRPFVGMANFQQIFNCQNFLNPTSCQEDRFWRGAFNTVFFVFFLVGGIILISLLTAVVLNRTKTGRGFFRSVYFYPVLLSPVVVALIWKWILQRDGLFNAVLASFGIEPILFFLNANWATLWVILISIWAQMGFYTLILLAGLQSIPTELYEAASIDGAGRGQSFRGITLPLLMPTLLVVSVLSIIRAVQAFDLVWVMTGGGPGTATTYVVQYIYETAFANQVQQYGLASAASMLLGFALLIFTLLQLRLGDRSDIA
jgi:alpha-1,4-digalacturonate transport system permease protein